MADDARQVRRRVGVMLACLVAVSLVSLCQSAYTVGVMYAPLEVLQSLPGYLRVYLGNVVGVCDLSDWRPVYEAHPHVYDIGTRAGITLITAVCGGLLAMAGSLFQMAFRNPIAAPTMLGVSNGIQLGVVLLLLQFGSAAVGMTSAYYLYTYLGALVVLVVVLGCGKLISGPGQFNVVDMLLVASIVSQLCAFVVTYLSTYVIDESLWETFYEVTEATTVNTQLVSYASLLVAVVVSVIPVFFLRFSMNMLSFTEQESKLSGVNPARLRVLALACGTVMVIVAQVQCGMIAMMSLVVPHLSRALLGADFKKQFWGNVVLGALLLLVCRFIVGWIPFVGEGVPIGTIVGFVTLPLYVWIMAKQQIGWL